MRKLLYTLILISTLSSCIREEEYIEVKRLDGRNNLTVIYMIAENNLETFAIDNINKMERSLPSNKNKLLVYCDTNSDAPKLYQIRKDDTEEIESKVLKTFDEQNSSSPEVINKVLSEIKNANPDKSLGLILWSHSTAWLPKKKKHLASYHGPKAENNSDDILTKSFGDDGGKAMDIIELKNAIPNGFKYIMFDSCLMGNIESVYELKDKAEYILASPTETLAEGLPYQHITKLLFANGEDEIRLKNIANEYYRYYNYELYKKNLNHPNPDIRVQANMYRTATISVTKTSELRNLAKEINRLLSRLPLKKWQYKHDLIQKLDSGREVETKLFDLLHFLEVNFGATETQRIKKQLKKTVIFKRSTEYYMKDNTRNGDYALANFSGLSCYVPRKNLKNLNSFYKKQSWTKDSGFSRLVD